MTFVMLAVVMLDNFCIINVLYFSIVAVINFNQSTYTVNEDNGYVYPVLVLSKPYQSYTIRIEDDSISASSELH